MWLSFSLFGLSVLVSFRQLVGVICKLLVFFRHVDLSNILYLTGLSGSDANGGCPQVCVLSHMVCDCTGHTTDLYGITLINDVAF